MLELTGELADGVLLNWTASNYLDRAISHLHRGANKAGRDPAEIDVAGYVRVAVSDNLEEARASLQGQIARYASNPFYHNFFRGMGFGEEMAAAEKAMQRGDIEEAAQSISKEMQDQVAVVGSPDECRLEIEKRRSLGLNLPVVAPFTVDEAKESYLRVIGAFEG
jgi:alkanesulfonate monooxygenase SsuD/methylene tetrahydromethanopterin reductase-like flavin-dependent oxidoreductase (luciferase family)